MEETVVTASGTSNLFLGGVLGGIIATMGIFAVVIAIAWYILQVIAYWKIFNKAGKPGWHSLIPVLNTWDEFDLSWNRNMAWCWLALMIVSGILNRSNNSAQNGDGSANGVLVAIASILGVVLFIMMIICTYKLAKAFGKGFGFFIGLLLLNPIFKLILGFGDARYQGRQG